MPWFRPSSLSHPITLAFPHLPQELAGLRIAHITDLHISSRRTPSSRLLAHLDSLEADLVFLTGDYMNHPGDEQCANAFVRRMLERLRPRLGVFGVFGNHDSLRMRQLLASAPIHWLSNQSLPVPGLPLLLLGFETDHHTRPDAMQMLLHCRPQGPWNPHDAACPRPLRLLLSHYPTYLPSASDLQIDLMFSGHTHGGQVRLSPRKIFYNSTDLPLHLSSGVLRYRTTLCAVSRGLGETFLPLRFLCPRHLPVYTLGSGPLPGHDSLHLQNAIPW